MNKTKDMTVGSPTKTIFFFSVPVLLGTLFQQIYNMADTIIVGQFLGEDALAAVGATGSTVYLVIGFASGLTQGCGILVSQAFGGHRLNELKKVVGTALLLTVVFSVILTIPTVSFSRQILLALHTPSNVLLFASSLAVSCVRWPTILQPVSFALWVTAAHLYISSFCRHS